MKTPTSKNNFVYLKSATLAFIIFAAAVFVPLFTQADSATSSAVLAISIVSASTTPIILTSATSTPQIIIPIDETATTTKIITATSTSLIGITLPGNICPVIGDTLGSITDAVTAAQASNDADAAARLEKLNASQASSTEKLAKYRGAWDTTYAATYNQILSEATTTKEKLAVQAFKGTITKALDTRRTAVDSALDTFQTSVAKLITTQASSTDEALLNFQTSASSTLALASSTCAMNNANASSTVAANLNASTTSDVASELANAETGLAAAIESPSDTQAKLTVLGNVRDAAVTKAEAAFSVTLEQSAESLEAAFGN